MMPPRTIGTRRYTTSFFAGLLLLGIAGAAAGDCIPVTAGNDTLGWNSVRRTFFGRALGQTFLATDTLLMRITVWRYPNDLNYTASHIFVTSVDTVNYSPPRPIAQGVLQNGPAVLVTNSDPAGLPIRMDFILDPPLALPHPGIYAFFVQREGCDAGETSIIAKEPGTYPYGTFWVTGRTINLPCYLASVDWWEDLDLCFEMEFCHDVSTPVRAETWGRLKVLYR